MFFRASSAPSFRRGAWSTPGVAATEMADSRAVVDPSSSFLFDDPTLEPIVNDEPYWLNLENNEWDDLFDSEDPLSDPVIWELFHGTQNSGMNDNRPQNPVFGDESGLLVPASQYNCVCCHVLREITHTNGN